MTYTIGYGEGTFPAILKRQVPAAEKYREQLDQLRDMGFLDQQVSTSPPSPLALALLI
jgi:hypothetical protein